MKKMMSIALALTLALTLICTGALAEETPRPEGGEKFESTWGMMNGLVEIIYEEEGYRVLVDLFNPADCTGTQWEYACYYIEEKDVLESLSSCKTPYTLNPDTLEINRGEFEYEGIDDEGATTIFSLSEDGALTWQDGREGLGQDLEFRDIGDFAGVWENAEKNIYTEFHWEGLYDEETYFYSVFVGIGDDDFHLIGLYIPEKGKLECYDTAAVQDAEGLYTALDAGIPCDAAFTDLGGGRLLFETDGAEAVELEFNLLGPES